MEVYGHCIRSRPSVPSLPTKGLYNNAKVRESIWWTLSVPGHLPTERGSIRSFATWVPSSGSFALEKSLVASEAIPKRSEFYGRKRFRVWTYGNVQLVRRHRISPRQHDRSNRTITFGTRTAMRVKSFVDEATANSADTGLDSPSVISERSDGEGSESTLHSVEELQAKEEQEGEEENEKFSSGTKLSEAGSTPSMDYSYEDMKLDQRRNWSMVDMKKLDQLRNFEYRHSDEKGVFVVQTMRIEHMRVVQELLVDSFAELMGGLLSYRPLLALTVRQYVQDRFLCLPDVVTLVGLYAPAEEIVKMGTSGDDGGNGSSASSMWRLAGTVELSFTDFGHPDVPAGPQPPRGSPYLCNMAVSRDYRRRGLGRQLLMAAEKLTLLRGSQDLYLHCRLIDSAPLNMYRGSGFQIIATDSFLSLLSFQRRRHLMHKKLQLTAEGSSVQNGHHL